MVEAKKSLKDLLSKAVSKALQKKKKKLAGAEEEAPNEATDSETPEVQVLEAGEGEDLAAVMKRMFKQLAVGTAGGDGEETEVEIATVDLDEVASGDEGKDSANA